MSPRDMCSVSHIVKPFFDFPIGLAPSVSFVAFFFLIAIISITIVIITVASLVIIIIIICMCIHVFEMPFGGGGGGDCWRERFRAPIVRVCPSSSSADALIQF